jgi:hypothetical protein
MTPKQLQNILLGPVKKKDREENQKNEISIDEEEARKQKGN